MTYTEGIVEAWAAEHAFWSVIADLPLPVVALDAEGLVRLWNNAASTMFGWTSEEVIGRPLPVVDEDTRDDFQFVLSTVLGGDSITGHETRRRTKAGNMLDIRVSYAPMRDACGAIQGALAILEDITDRKQAEAERELLLAREQAARAEAEVQRARLQMLFMEAPARIAVTRGPDLVYEFANTRYLSTMRDPDIIGKPAAEVFPEAAEQGIVAAGKRVYETGEPFIGFEQRFTIDYDGDGIPEDRYFNAVLQPLPEPDGRIDGVMLFTVDVTEQVRARQEAERLAAERAAILGQIADCLLLTDENLRVAYANQAAIAMLGFDPTGMEYALMARRINTRMADPAQAGVPGNGAFVALTEGRQFGSVYSISRLHGPDIVVEGTASPIVGDDGRRLGVATTFRDITARYTLNRQKDDFLAAAAHDLKTPLTTIKGQTQLLQRRVERLPPEMTAGLGDGLSRIDKTATRMTQLIGRLLDMTRLQMNQPLDLMRRPIDLVHLVRGAIAEAQDSSSHHQIVLDTSLPTVIGEWDGFRLERLIGNLLSNAIKYSPEGGEVRVTIKREDGGGKGWAVLAVRDQGIGIPPDELSHIFDRFYRARNVEGLFPGAGIGLADMKGVIEQHGGTVSVESEVGAGTVFTVRLPLSPA